MREKSFVQKKEIRYTKSHFLYEVRIDLKINLKNIFFYCSDFLTVSLTNWKIKARAGQKNYKVKQKNQNSIVFIHFY